MFECSLLFFEITRWVCIWSQVVQIVVLLWHFYRLGGVLALSWTRLDFGPSLNTGQSLSYPCINGLLSPRVLWCLVAGCSAPTLRARSLECVQLDPIILRHLGIALSWEEVVSWLPLLSWVFAIGVEESSAVVSGRYIYSCVLLDWGQFTGLLGWPFDTISPCILHLLLLRQGGECLIDLSAFILVLIVLYFLLGHHDYILIDMVLVTHANRHWSPSKHQSKVKFSSNANYNPVLNLLIIVFIISN